MKPDTRRSRAERDAGYEAGVFINCPFDEDYQILRDAIVFAVFDCGLIPHLALEFGDANRTRIDKIVSLIKACRWGIHDLSRVELNDGLPRFNMPFEYGLFVGATKFGGPGQSRKRCLVFDTAPFRFQKTISDVSGYDITPHGGKADLAIDAIRNWISDALPDRASPIPGGFEIHRRYLRFLDELPELCREVKILPEQQTFNDYTRTVSRWLKRDQAVSF